MLRREWPGRPLVGVGVIVLRGASVLLVRRGRDPGRGSWAFPGGAQRLGETVEACGRRELREEAGVRAGALRLAGYVDAIHPGGGGTAGGAGGKAGGGGPRFHYTIIDLAGAWEAGEPVAGGDAEAAAFVTPGEAAGLLGGESLRLLEVARGLVERGAPDA